MRSWWKNSECKKWGIGVRKNLKVYIKTCKTLVIGSAILFESLFNAILISFNIYFSIHTFSIPSFH